MAQVYGQVAGGDPKELTATSVGDARAAMGVDENHSSLVNGVPAISDAQTLTDYQVVTFAPKVKGN